MSRWADWFSVTDHEADRFVRAHESGGDEAVLEMLRPYSEDDASDLAMDKLWEPIHRCLTGDHAPAHMLNFNAGEFPLKLAVLGGAYLLEEGYRSLQYVCSDEVPDVAAALSALDRDWFQERFFALPPKQYLPITEEWFEEVWKQVQKLAAFYRKAAAKGHVVFCTISH
jgi:hypothetical protein